MSEKKETGGAACDCTRQPWQRHAEDCAITKAHQRAYARSEVHQIGCGCGACQCARIAAEWDPRMGAK